jgi:polysaccharide biosynthesis/export protein
MKNCFRHFYLLPLLIFCSCIFPKEVTYFQNSQDFSLVSSCQDPIIQSGDLLTIRVASLNMESDPYFSFNSEKSALPQVNYLVDSKGFIEFPLLGQLKVSGMTTREGSDYLKTLLQKYLESPSVMLRLDNFRVTILGEVTKPGIYNVPNERINILEALGLAGDLTIYARRKNVLLLRESKEMREFIRIDLTSTDLFKSPSFYLKSGDVIYVEPGRERLGAIDNFYRIVPIVMSGLTILSIIMSRIV